MWTPPATSSWTQHGCPLTLTLYTEVAEYVEGVGYVERQRALPAMCAKGTGRYTFDDVSMRATFGMKCVLRILSSTAGISEFISSPLTMESCMAGVEYGAAGTFQCKRCPRHGVCDGTPRREVPARLLAC